MGRRWRRKRKTILTFSELLKNRFVRSRTIVDWDLKKPFKRWKELSNFYYFLIISIHWFADRNKVMSVLIQFPFLSSLHNISPQKCAKLNSFKKMWRMKMWWEKENGKIIKLHLVKNWNALERIYYNYYYRKKKKKVWLAGSCWAGELVELLLHPSPG